MDHKARTEFGLKPCCLRRHYIACVCDIDELVHSHGIKSQGHLHFATVHTALELLEAAYAAYEVYTLVRTQVGDTQDITQDEVGADSHVKHADRILVVICALFSGEAVPLAFEIK